jgi:8-oxo-dGTP pyrophosphatase MutT (NUDIX family)
MTQIYTIFIHDVPIYLVGNLEFSSYQGFYYKDEITIKKLLSIAISGKYNAIYLYHEDLVVLWKEFKGFFKIEKAAGGLVKNKRDQVLFIYRFDKWDLPKGKIEKGEKKKHAAIREVEEECGISGLKIINKLPRTFHIFQRNERETLKITYWYAMESNFKDELVPQEEEGITMVGFRGEEGIKEALKNTYGNIKLLFKNLAMK